jgi:hypothetical protein
MEVLERTDDLLLELSEGEQPITIKVDFSGGVDKRGKKIPTRVHKCEVPQAFYKLNPEQFESLACFLFYKKNSKEVAFLNFLMTLFAMDQRLFLELEAEDIKDLRFLAKNFIGVEPISVRSLYPTVTLNNTVMNGPDSLLSNLELDEYIYVDNLFTAYLKCRKEITEERKDLEHLNSLIAALYRGKNISFSEYLEEVDLRNKEIMNVPLEQRIAGFYNYMALRNAVAKKFEKVFKEGGEPDGFGWRRTIKDLAGEKFGTTREVRTSPLLDVFMYLHDNNSK